MGMTPENARTVAQDDIQRLIVEHASEDPAALALKWHGRSDLPVKEIAEQLACRRRAKGKLPSIACGSFVYEREALEICSSEATAAYKSRVMSGTRLIDMTGGLGIDSLFLSNSFDEVVYCERDAGLCEVFRANLRFRAAANVAVREGDSLNILSSCADSSFDWLYADPKRRESGRRSVALERSSPNVVAHRELFLRKARNVCVKCSPMLDLTKAIAQFVDVSKVIVVSVDGEQVLNEIVGADAAELGHLE